MRTKKLITALVCPLLAVSQGLAIENSEVTPSNADELGFLVQVEQADIYLTGRVHFPSSIDKVWRPAYAVVSFRDGPDELFVSRTDFEGPTDGPVVVSFDLDGDRQDAAVTIFYECAYQDSNACDEKKEITFRIRSIRAFWP